MAARSYEGAVYGGIFKVYTGVTDFADIDGTGTNLGFTRSVTLNFEGEIRAIQVDGQLGNVKGSLRETTKNMSVSLNLMEWAEDTILMKALRLIKTTNANTTTYTPKSTIEVSDYLTNVVIVGQTNNGDQLIIEMNNVIATNELSMSFEDKNEVVLPVTLMANYSSGDSRIIPWSIRVVKPVAP